MTLLIETYSECIVFGIAILSINTIRIGIANTFTGKYWYWCCQYIQEIVFVLPILLLVSIGISNTFEK